MSETITNNSPSVSNAAINTEENVRPEESIDQNFVAKLKQNYDQFSAKARELTPDFAEKHIDTAAEFMGNNTLAIGAVMPMAGAGNFLAV
jgi:hypothetical protein